MGRTRNPATKSARKRWLVFSNGLESSKFWPFGRGQLDVELPDFHWPREWDYHGIAREVRYDSDKMLPDKHDDSAVPYLHDFRSKPPYVKVYGPRGSAPYGQQVPISEIRRRSFAHNSSPRFPDSLAFLAKCDGWSVCPPGQQRNCAGKDAYEAFPTDCILMASPEGDLLAVLDGGDNWRCQAIFVGPTLVVEREGIDD